MRINLASLKNEQEVKFQDQIDYSNETFDPLFLRGIKDCKVNATIGMYDDLLRVKLFVSATLITVCSYSLEDVPLPVKIDDEIDIDIPTEENMIENNELVFDSYVLSLLVASVPIKVVKKDAKKLEDGNGYRVLTEDELIKERSSSKKSPFDVLDDLDL